MTKDPQSLHSLASSHREAEQKVPSEEEASAQPASQGKRRKKLSRTEARRKTRQRILQALYQCYFNPLPSTKLVQQFYDDEVGEEEGNDMFGVDADFFQAALSTCVDKTEQLDELYCAHLKMPIDRLDPVELCILRLAVFELSERLDVPRRVVINEAVELAKSYGAEDGHKFINGVIDKTARDLRPHEQ